MSFKEELRRKRNPRLSFFGEKKKYLNRVDIHVIYVKSFKSVMDIWGYTIHMNKTLGICEINPMIRVLIK